MHALQQHVCCLNITYNLCGIGVVEAATSATCWLCGKHAAMLWGGTQYNKKWVAGAALLLAKLLRSLCMTTISLHYERVCNLQCA